jgi:hypothetical protein
MQAPNTVLQQKERILGAYHPKNFTYCQLRAILTIEITRKKGVFTPKVLTFAVHKIGFVLWIHCIATPHSQREKATV